MDVAARLRREQRSRSADAREVRCSTAATRKAAASSPADACSAAGPTGKEARRECEDPTIDAFEALTQHNGNTMKTSRMAGNLLLPYDSSERNRAAIDAPDMPVVLNTGVPTSGFVQESNHSECQIFIRSCSETYLLNINLHHSTVGTLKSLIEEREGIPVNEQYLILGGIPLLDGTLLGDYAIGYQSTIDVCARIRGGAGLEELSLEQFTQRCEIFKDANVYNRKTHKKLQQNVLNTCGVRLLRGIMSCVLKAHNCDLALGDQLRKEKLWVSVFRNDSEYLCHEVVLRSNISATAHLTNANEKEDYKQLRAIVQYVFAENNRRHGYPLHVDSIVSTLDYLSLSVSLSRKTADRTQLLQAVAATAEPVQMATMWLNLIRLQKSLEANKQTVFWNAAKATKQSGWGNRLTAHPRFQKTYYYKAGCPGNRIPRYGKGSDDLLRFARNWFTHAPQESWIKVDGLPALDYIFTYHFKSFMTNLLINLYKEEIDLSTILVPMY